MFDYRDATALIAGASSGIGEAFASALAARGTHLILVARTKPKLEALAQRLAKQHGIQATTIEADLTGGDAVLRPARRQPAAHGARHARADRR